MRGVVPAAGHGPPGPVDPGRATSPMRQSTRIGRLRWSNCRMGPGWAGRPCCRRDPHCRRDRSRSQPMRSQRSARLPARCAAAKAWQDFATSTPRRRFRRIGFAPVMHPRKEQRVRSDAGCTAQQAASSGDRTGSSAAHDRPRRIGRDDFGPISRERKIHDSGAPRRQSALRNRGQPTAVSCSRRSASAAQRISQKRTNSLKPPKIMRAASNGIAFGSLRRRGSAMTALLMRSRSRRER